MNPTALTDEQQMITEMVHQFVDEQVLRTLAEQVNHYGLAFYGKDKIRNDRFFHQHRFMRFIDRL